VKINQYCSVCKKHLDMEVIPTDDGGDDGVIWLRCPECQGFLPKFTGEGMKQEAPPAASAADADADPAQTDTETAAAPPPAVEAPAPPVAAEAPAAEIVEPDEGAESDASSPPAEPIAEYAAQLAAADTTTAKPYRPSSQYAVGDVVLHLAYDDVGIVVAKERLPGGRKAVKVFFDGAGVVHLIEQAAEGH
jgi:hypothetical protein